jgi:hypothetical protein
MERQHFDVLLLDEGTPFERYVAAASLRDGRCVDHAQQIRPAHLISDAASLSVLLLRMRTTSWLFVLTSDRVGGIVTHADLQKAPVRLWLFGLATLVEMHLLAMVRILYPHDSWRSRLTQGRVAQAECLYKQRLARDEDMDLADCLQLCDKRDLVLKSAVGRAALGMSKKKAESFLDDVEHLRDRLAHGQDIVGGTDWPTVIDLAQRIDSLLTQLEQWWIGQQAGRPNPRP